MNDTLTADRPVGDDPQIDLTMLQVSYTSDGSSLDLRTMPLLLDLNKFSNKHYLKKIKCELPESKLWVNRISSQAQNTWESEYNLSYNLSYIYITITILYIYTIYTIYITITIYKSK